ncbi:activating transcription factor 7-interacting protein 2 [Tiliqua scincoides]|uniref:activating transcription factor 7-interacting protein 2 n=1 Tax=Tiliqua scincoides TaxID=71010 RepID=UPI003462060C
MDSNMNIRKPLFARKTMTPSCRKQVEMLKRIRKLERTGSGSSSRESPDRLAGVDTNGLNCSSLQGQNILLSPPPASHRPGTESVVGSTVDVCGGSPQVAGRQLPRNPSDTNSDTEEFLNAGALQDILCQWYEKESCCPLSKPVEVHLDVVLTSHLSDRSKEPKSPAAGAANHAKGQDRKEPLLGGPNRVISEQESHVASHSHQEQDREEPPLGNPTPVVSERESRVVSHSQEEATVYSVLPDKAPRKRRLLESNKGTPGKRPKTSDGAGENGNASPERWQNGLGEVKSFIQGHLDAATGDLDHNVQCLKERIDRTQCLRKHEEITIKIVKRISRLDRRVNAVFAAQKAELSKKTKLPGSESSNMILNCRRSLPNLTNNQSVPSPNTTSAGGKDSPRATESLTSSRASPQVAESSEDVICLDAEKHHPGVPTAKAPDVQQNGASVVADASAKTPDSRKNEPVIDLTEEGSSAHPSEDELGKEEEKTASNNAKPAPEAPKVNPPQQALPSPKEVPREGSHLPPLPKIRLLPEMVTDFKGTLPPQKLELTVVKLLNPKGVALQLDVSHVDPRCALLESIHLFYFVENASTRNLFSWTRMKVIKALPLPMFISLGELHASGTYYFTVQSKDIYGRYGPFCDIRSVSVT